MALNLAGAELGGLPERLVLGSDGSPLRSEKDTL